MKIGLWLPTFARPTVSVADLRVGESAARAERLGFASLWTIDHLLPAYTVHASSWYDPFLSLATAAAATMQIQLGTASLVAGVRHPFALAKQVATLAALAGPRVALGASSGWYAGEYDLFGYSIRERRGRTDECLAALRELLDKDAVTFEGKYWRFSEAALVPRPNWHVPILIGGGSRLPEAGSEHDRPYLAESVLARILRYDGWLAPCAGSEQLTLHDLEVVRTALSDRPGGSDAFRLVHVQWTHVVDSDDGDRAVREQLPHLRALMGANRSDEHLLECYLTGSREDIADRIARMRSAGFDELVIGPVTADQEQIELIHDVARDAGQRADA
jgi:alkanesulfonate monooxygenase SsuD/methylene tetrahydromethanopterin reductase-like flavin-dependent oxidoreductase (luciferase family)